MYRWYSILVQIQLNAYMIHIYIHINIPRQSTLGKLYIHRLDYMNPIWKKNILIPFLKKVSNCWSPYFSSASQGIQIPRSQHQSLSLGRPDSRSMVRIRLMAIPIGFCARLMLSTWKGKAQKSRWKSRRFAQITCYRLFMVATVAIGGFRCWMISYN